MKKTAMKNPNTRSRRPHRRGDAQSRLMMMLTGAVFLLFGIVATISAFRSSTLASESRSWPTTDGTITASAVDYQRTTRTGKHGSNRRSRVNEWSNVSYEYWVNESKYQSDRVSFGSDGGQETVDKYPIGKKVTVYYKPGQHEVSVLEPGSFWPSLLPLFGGLGFAAVGSFLCWYVAMHGDKS